LRAPAVVDAGEILAGAADEEADEGWVVFGEGEALQ